jgi:hypothetical protein
VIEKLKKARKIDSYFKVYDKKMNDSSTKEAKKK